MCLGLPFFKQQGHFPIETMRGKGGHLNFPIIAPENEGENVRKINHFLQLHELGLLQGKHDRHAFERVYWLDDFMPRGKVSMDYEIHQNSSNVLSIGFQEAFDGATLSYWNAYYNFNAANGDVVQLEDLFSRRGFELFKAYLLKKRVQDLNRLLKKDSSFTSVKEQVLGFYESHYGLEDFYIKDGYIHIDNEDRFPKAFFGIAELTNRPTRIKVAHVTGYLNEYGRVLFGLEAGDLATYRSKSLPQLYTGRVGQSNPVIFILENPYDTQYSGHYAYLKYGKGLHLSGKKINEIIQLNEYDGFWDFTNFNGYLQIKYDPKQPFLIKGKWLDDGKDKSYSFQVSR